MTPKRMKVNSYQKASKFNVYDIKLVQNMLHKKIDETARET